MEISDDDLDDPADARECPRAHGIFPRIGLRRAAHIHYRVNFRPRPPRPVHPSHLVRLLSLSAIWGASFLFMRVSAPVMGPAWLILTRLTLATLFLAGVALWRRQPLPWRTHWRHFAVLGLFNTALPFWLFAYAAQQATASLLSVLNATAPIWAAVMGALWLRTRLSAKALLGLALGISGVLLLAGVESLHLPAGGGLAIAAGLLAAACYGVATTYTKTAQAIEPFANAHGSLWGATLWMLPLATVSPLPPLPLPLGVMLAVLALGVVCSGVAYLLYFRLVADLGPAPALTVTFLIPVFGILWGCLFLGEQVGWHTAVGGLMVLSGTALVTGLKLPAAWLKRGRHAT